MISSHLAQGTPDYLAPEVLLAAGHDNKVDWWALGVVLFELLTGYPPFNAQSPQAIFVNILSLKIRWPEPEEGDTSDDELISPAARDLIERLLVLDPEARLDVVDIQTHPFFAGVDWSTLLEQPAEFIPSPRDAVDTRYFDGRGVHMDEADFAARQREEAAEIAGAINNAPPPLHDPMPGAPAARAAASQVASAIMDEEPAGDESDEPDAEDIESINNVNEPETFAGFDFKNIGLLDAENLARVSRANYSKHAK